MPILSWTPVRLRLTLTLSGNKEPSTTLRSTLLTKTQPWVPAAHSLWPLFTSDCVNIRQCVRFPWKCLTQRDTETGVGGEEETKNKKLNWCQYNPGSTRKKGRCVYWWWWSTICIFIFLFFPSFASMFPCFYYLFVVALWLVGRMCMVLICVRLSVLNRPPLLPPFVSVSVMAALL